MDIRGPGYGAAPRPGMSNRPYEPTQGPAPAVPRRGSYQSPAPVYARPYEDSRERDAYNDTKYRYHRRPDTPIDRPVFQGGRDGYVPSHVNSRYGPYSRPGSGPEHAHQRRPRPLPGFRRSSPDPSEGSYTIHDPRMPHHPRPRSPPYIREAILPSDYYANLTVINDINRRRKYDQKMARQSAKMANGPPASAPTDLAPVMLFAPRKPSASISAASSLAISPVGDDASSEIDVKPSEADKASAISLASDRDGSFKSPDKLRTPSKAATPLSSVSAGSSKPVIAITTTGLTRTGIRELATTSTWSAGSHSGSTGTGADNSAKTGSSLQSVNLQSDVSAISAVEARDHSGSSFHGGRTTAARALSLLSAVADETLRADMSAVYRKAEGLNMSSPMRSPREAIRDFTDLNGPLRLQSIRVAPAVEVSKAKQNEQGDKRQQPPDIEMRTDASAENEASTLAAHESEVAPASEPPLRTKSASPGPVHFQRPARDQCTPALSPVIESPIKGHEHTSGSSDKEAPIDLDELEEPGTSTSLRSHMAAELLLGVGDAEVEGKHQVTSVAGDSAETCYRNAAVCAADLQSGKSKETHTEMEVDLPAEPATVAA